jgi:hypothetical protein
MAAQLELVWLHNPSRGTSTSLLVESPTPLQNWPGRVLLPLTGRADSVSMRPGHECLGWRRPGVFTQLDQWTPALPPVALGGVARAYNA